MRELPLVLAHIAALVATSSGCTFSTGSCDGFVPTRRTLTVTSDTACAIANDVTGAECDKTCGPGLFVCTLPDDYARAFAAAQSSRPAEAGVVSDTGGAAPGGDSGASLAICPSVTGTVNVACANTCTGRRTQGTREPTLPNQASAGDYFAACSYLEAVSVHAFERLHVELKALGAPTELLAATKRAMKDETRHAMLMCGLARRFGAEPEHAAVSPNAVRTRFEIARENAVEGCIRETYGAVLGLIGAMRARDPKVRAVMHSIARDECEHAALSWRIANWMTAQLDEHERRMVRSAMREAVSQLSAREQSALSDECRVLSGMPTREERRHIFQLLDREVFLHAA
jgi:hypothetical protein